MFKKGHNTKYPTEQARIQARREACKKWRVVDPDRYKATILKRSFGMELRTFKDMWACQEGKCLICTNPLKMGIHGHAVDHCHKTGKIRGLLCGPCNTGIGSLRDDPKLLIKAAKYLKKYA